MRSIVALLGSLLVAGSATAAPRADHVFIVSIDGGKPKVIQEAEMPTVKRLAAEGASTWVANTIVPPKTLPSHTSMLTGMGPDKHQVLWNDWMPIRGLVKVPTVFSLTKQRNPAAVTAAFVGKVKFRHLWLKNSLDVFDFNGPQDGSPVPGAPEIEKTLVPAQTVARQASAYIVDKKPRLCFIHFPDADSAGHRSGWGSPEQKEAFKVCDQALSQIVKAVNAAGIAGSSVIIVTADHGGTGKNHQFDTPDDRNIPWIAWGKGVKKGHAISTAVNTFDTAATALWLLDIPLSPDLDGRPVTEAFEAAVAP